MSSLVFLKCRTTKYLQFSVKLVCDFYLYTHVEIVFFIAFICFYFVVWDGSADIVNIGRDELYALFDLPKPIRRISTTEKKDTNKDAEDDAPQGYASLVHDAGY
jgi:hypothetical protein